jgi:hypothetical protein
MRKIDFDPAVRHAISAAFDPAFMGTGQFFKEAKAIFFEEIGHVPITPIVQSAHVPQNRPAAHIKKDTEICRIRQASQDGSDQAMLYLSSISHL